MLVDVKTTNPRGQNALLLSVIADGSPNCEHIGTGMYRLGHWNFDLLVAPDVIADEYPEARTDEPEWDCIGVCDSPEQLIERYPFLVTSPRRFVVAMVEIRKADQPPSGGWRWHKWGDYIGSQNPTHEYLYHEPDIDSVWTFHIYEVN